VLQLNKAFGDTVYPKHSNINLEILRGAPKFCAFLGVKIKVKESRNRPGVAQRVPGGLGSQIS